MVLRLPDFPRKLLAWKHVFPVPVAFMFPVRTVLPELRLFLGLPVSVT